MRKKRVLIDGVFYHVTSRTNNKIRVFGNKLGYKIMLKTLQDAKDKYRFRLANFCIMPTHFHLLIEPAQGTSLSRIIQWIKTCAAKRWNRIHGSIDHLWGERFFSQPIKSQMEYEYVMGYIDQNAVTAGLVSIPEEWKASGAYYKARNIPDLVDFTLYDCLSYVKLISPTPTIVSGLYPQVQFKSFFNKKLPYI